MGKKMIISAEATSTAELLSQTVVAISEAQRAAKQVFSQKESFRKLTTFLDKIAVILKELLKLSLECQGSLKDALEMLNQEVRASKQLALECVAKNKVYLLVNCRNIVRCLEDNTNKIGQALSLVPLAYPGIPSRVNNQIKKLCKGMLDAEYQVGKAEEEILEKIELGIQERNTDRSYANYLLVCVAEAIGISTEQSELKREFQEFKKETEEAALGRDAAEGIYMEQVITLLEKADAITSEVEKEMKYFEKQNGLGKQPLEPLRSFYCPITQEVMEDPVETSYGITFERVAIEKWFSEGNDRCPLTNVTLDNLSLRPNRTLRKSIEEWKDRNTMITIASIKSRLQSQEEQEVIQSLVQLHDLCLERELHCEWITIEDYTPILIGLLDSKDREIRKHALLILLNLAKYSDRNKERIAEMDNALKSIVRSLARQISESKLAVQLLVELSRINEAQEFIGTIQGCIFLLVTMLSSKDAQASKYSQELLDNLSFHEQNVIQMAKANYFRPLLHLLSSGTKNVKMVMAETLSKIELTDHHKLSLFRDGALEPLLQLLSDDDLEVKKVAISALHNLSNLPQNGQQMIREGAQEQLFELLYRHSLSWPSLRQQVAAIIMNLSISTAAQDQEAHDTVRLMKSDDDIFRFFCLISLTGPEIQQSILKAFQAMCQSPCGHDIRIKLRELSAVQVLVQLCELENHSVRANAIKLFSCLTEDGDDGSTFLEHVGQRCVETLLRVIKTSNDVEEVSAAMAIISNLPKDQQIAHWLLDAGVLETVHNCLTNGNRDASHKKSVTAYAVSALCRFTVSTNQEWQKRVAEAGLIPVLVQLLHSGSTLTKKKAAISLKQLSESSVELSKPLIHSGVFWCCMAASESGCPVHAGMCSVETTFCILEANAVNPLVKLLEEADIGVCEASFDALLTLIDEEERMQRGVEVLAEANAIGPIVKLLSSPCARLQEKSLKTLEGIFRLVELKQRYGASAQMPLVDITQRGSNVMKSLAAKVLCQLDVLGEQSSYF